MVSELEERVRESAERNALLNAISHEGRAEVPPVLNKVFGEVPEARNLKQAVLEIVRSAVEKVNRMSPEEQRKEAEERKIVLTKKVEVRAAADLSSGGLRELPNARKGEVVLRMPPEPSGYMHIGHAMAFSINYLYKKKYEGKLWLRFEDTNPKKVLLKYYENFRQGIKWLGIQYDYERIVSKDIDLIYDYARKLIVGGNAYACSCSQERVKKLRFEGIECEHRNSSVEKNVRIFEEMLSFKYNEGDYVIRLKGDMKNDDYSLRDPNILRIIKHEHPITGKKYCVWPTYDLANVIEDEVCGVTHILRSSEFHTALQELIRRMLGFRNVNVIQFSRFNFKGTPVQKRLLRPLVESKVVSGWDDPRMPTVDGVRRRGILPEAIIRFTQEVGYTNVEHVYDWSLLFSVNRKILDPIAKRIFFVQDPVKLFVEGFEKKVRIRLHPEKELGSRELYVREFVYISSEDFSRLADGQEFRLIDLCNLRLVNKEERKASFSGNELKQEIPKIQWVPEESLSIRVMVPDVLYMENGELNKESMRVSQGLAERYFDSIQVGEVFQFVRYGFCRKDDERTAVFAHK